MHPHTDSEAGFSLIELMIALVVTLVITGAVFGLLSGGQSAFRREPDMTDRQQNIRLAMDVITRDIASAGIGMPPFIQAFTPGLDHVGPANQSGGNADELSMLANTSNVDPEALCGYGGSASHIRAHRDNTLVPTQSVSLVLLQNGGWTIRYVEVTHHNQGTGGNPNLPSSCEQQTLHDDFMMNSGHNDPTGLNAAGGLCNMDTNSIGYNVQSGCRPQFIGAGEFVSYRIRADSDGVPNLQRRSSGTASTALAFGDTGNWQVVARGIEDLQVEYTQQNGNVSPSVSNPTGAPIVDTATTDYSTLVTKVKVTLSARGTAKKVAGATTGGTGAPNAIRGSMTTETAIRAALQWLNAPSPAPTGSPSPLWN